MPRTRLRPSKRRWPAVQPERSDHHHHHHGQQQQHNHLHYAPNDSPYEDGARDRHRSVRTRQHGHQRQCSKSSYVSHIRRKRYRSRSPLPPVYHHWRWPAHHHCCHEVVPQCPTCIQRSHQYYFCCCHRHDDGIDRPPASKRPRRTAVHRSTPSSGAVASPMRPTPAISRQNRARRHQSHCLSDDSDGHLRFKAGDTIRDGRYQLRRILGEGTFGRVVQVRDVERNAVLALKIVKNAAKYRDAARLEVNVLKKLADFDPYNVYKCVRLLDDFVYKGHRCLAFDMLGQSVFEFMKANCYRPYPMDQVKRMTHEITAAVKFLHDHHLTHTDLKPENILFYDSTYDLLPAERETWLDDFADYFSDDQDDDDEAEDRSRSRGESRRHRYRSYQRRRKPYRRVRNPEIRLIDFGSATFDDEHHSTVVATRHYRPPEVILELEWDSQCDIWSLGCIFFELATGLTLFQTHDNREHMAMIETTLASPMPVHMVRQAPRSLRRKYFDSHYNLVWDPESTDGRYVAEHCKPLAQYIPRRFRVRQPTVTEITLDSGSSDSQDYRHRRHCQFPVALSGQSTSRADSGVVDVSDGSFRSRSAIAADWANLFDLVAKMLEYDPEQRTTLARAMRHAYLAPPKTPNGPTAGGELNAHQARLGGSSRKRRPIPMSASSTSFC